MRKEVSEESQILVSRRERLSTFGSMLLTIEFILSKSFWNTSANICAILNLEVMFDQIGDIFEIVQDLDIRRRIDKYINDNNTINATVESMFTEHDRAFDDAGHWTTLVMDANGNEEICSAEAGYQAFWVRNPRGSQTIYDVDDVEESVSEHFANVNCMVYSLYQSLRPMSGLPQLEDAYIGPGVGYNNMFMHFRWNHDILRKNLVLLGRGLDFLVEGSIYNGWFYKLIAGIRKDFSADDWLYSDKKYDEMMRRNNFYQCMQDIVSAWKTEWVDFVNVQNSQVLKKFLYLKDYRPNI